MPLPETGDFEHLTVADVSRVYGRRRALAHVSLTCAAGQVIGLLGPNGAGKSTLLGVLSTLTAPSAGEVRYGDRTAREAGASLRAHIGFLSHDLQLYPELSARENLDFFAGLHGLDRPAERVADALRSAALADRADDVVEGFSRGMRQRLALERALLHSPRLVLFDEPFTGLDETACDTLVTRVRVLRAERRIIVLATHDLDVVDGLLDRAVVLRRGRMREVGDGGSLRERYRAALLDGDDVTDRGDQRRPAGSGAAGASPSDAATERRS